MIGRKKPGDLVSSSQSTEPKKRYRESARQTSKTMGEPCDASMRSNRRRERLQQREQEEALESVRSLNEWRANSEPSLRTTPPPTDRLYLDLDTRNIGHGKTEEQKQALRKQKEERATREAKRHQVIVSNIKRLEELEGDERDKLNTQLKVLDRLSPRCKGANDAANKMLSLFRKCSPDEFGFVRKRNFLHEMRRNYGLDHPEAERLFRIASDNGDEITYKQFRNAFSRIDKSTTFIPESYRPILKRDPDEQAHREAPPSPQPVAPKSFPEVAQVLNEFGVEVSADALTNLYGAKDSSEPQELTFSQLHRRTADYFAQLEAGDAAVGDDHRSMELKGQYLGCRRMLKPLEDAEKARKKSGAASEAATSNQHADHTSDAALPKDDRQENDKEGARRRRRRRRRRRHSALPTVSETMAQIRNPTREEDNIWKAHWTDKTIPKTDRTPGIRITDTGRRMQRGNGDILRWESDSLEPHPLETYRELDTGRSTLSSASFYSDFY